MSAIISMILLLAVVSKKTAIVEATLGKNVLMIVVDDLRPELGKFTGTDKSLNKNIDTPFIDALTEKSIKFKNAHAQFTTCGPSRASFLTGRRPDTSGVTNKNHYFRDADKLGPTVKTLPQHFKEQGYKTYGIGKVFHTGHDDETYSWNEVIQPENEAFWHKGVFNGESWGMADTDAYSKNLPDQEILNSAKQKLRSVGSDSFFIAVGFKRPHLPFICPTEYFDKYPESDIDLPKYADVPDEYPDIAWSGWLDLADYEDIKSYDNSFGNGLPDTKTKELRRAYYACVSWVDNMVGELLETLEVEGLADDTVILFMSDHGFHLGEHSEWTKGTLLHLDTHVPMMLRVPGETDSGIVTDAFVENIDVFATLVEAAGVDDVPQCPESSQPDLCHEGMSAYRYIANPDGKSKKWALSQYSRQDSYGITYMGYSIENSKYHYVRWVNYDSGTPDFDDVAGEELYDRHKGKYLKFFGKKLLIKNSLYDPNEMDNQAKNIKYDDIVDKMYGKLKAGYMAAMP